MIFEATGGIVRYVVGVKVKTNKGFLLLSVCKVDRNRMLAFRLNKSICFVLHCRMKRMRRKGETDDIKHVCVFVLNMWC